MNETSTCCSPETERYKLFARNVWIYGASGLIVCGTIGNILSGLVMQRKRQRQYTTGFYLTYLAFLDTVILYVGLCRQWIMTVYGIDIRAKTAGLCKLHIFLLFYLIQLEAWLLSCVAIERAGAVWWPVKAKQIFTRRFAVIQVISMNAFLFVLNTHIFWTQALVQTDEGPLCVKSPDFYYFRMFVWNWVDMTLSSVLPFIVMLTCNVAVITKIVIQKRKQKQGSSQGKVQSVTVMLLVVSFAFFICTLPITIYLSDSEMFSANYGCCASNYVWWPVLNMLLYSNNMANFLLYCVSGSRFRKELKLMLTCKANQVGPNSTR